ncbi:ubiquitin conjugating enzyme, partial [Histoplasma capsulatum]
CLTKRFYALAVKSVRSSMARTCLLR